MQDIGAAAILGDYASGAGYKEKRGTIKKGSLGSGEEVTVIPSILQIGNDTRYVRTAYVIRGKAGFGLREFIVFFFHNSGTSRKIDDDTVTSVTWSATKMF